MAISLIGSQHNAASATGSSGTIAVSFPANVTLASLITGFAEVGANVTISVADNVAGQNAYQTDAIATYWNSGFGIAERAFFVKNAGDNVACQVTATFGSGGGTFRTIHIQEWSPGTNSWPAAAGALDNATRNTGTSGTAAPSAATPTNDNELVVGECWVEAPSSINYGGSFNGLNVEVTVGSATEYVVQTTKASVQTSFTFTSALWEAHQVFYRTESAASADFGGTLDGATKDDVVAGVGDTITFSSISDTLIAA